MDRFTRFLDDSLVVKILFFLAMFALVAYSQVKPPGTDYPEAEAWIAKGTEDRSAIEKQGPTGMWAIAVVGPSIVGAIVLGLGILRPPRRWWYVVVAVASSMTFAFVASLLLTHPAYWIANSP